MSGEAMAPPSVPMAAEASDVVTPGLAARFLATLGREPGVLRAGDPAPPGLHWCLALEAPRAHEIAPDGIAEGGIFPTLAGLPRRVWGGAEITFSAPLRLGDAVTRRSRVLDVSRKTGRTGALAFVRIENSFTVEGHPCLSEVQTIVYREPDRGEHVDRVASPAPPEGRVLRRLTPDPAMLFRFSALTFNAHRIHYDRPYARDQEGYPGLLVHGPLTAALILDAAFRHFGGEAIRAVSLRATAPVICEADVTLVASGASVAAVSDGRPAMLGAFDLSERPDRPES